MRNPHVNRMNQISYRVSQFWDVLLNTQLKDDELDLVASILTKPQLHLYNQLQNSEKMHALRVLKAVKEGGESHPDLLTAALLHDVGKSIYPLRLWERIIIVLGKRIFPHLSNKWGQSHPRGMARPFVIAQNHPRWGADLAEDAGSSSLAVALILNHENHQKSDPPDSVDDHSVDNHSVDDHSVDDHSLYNQLLQALQNADNHN